MPEKPTLTPTGPPTLTPTGPPTLTPTGPPTLTPTTTPKNAASSPPPATLTPTPRPPNPLDNIEYTDNIETDSTLEIDALAQAFRDRTATETKRYATVTDSEYWVCLCFTDRATAEQFLTISGIGTPNDKYIDGHQAAETLGINLTRKEETE